MKQLTEVQLRALCEEWQKRLRLQDWDIELRVARERELSHPANGAECHWNLGRRMAQIFFVDMIDHDPARHYPFVQELLLIHELLHLHFAPFDTFAEDSPQGVAIEQAIEGISRALLALKQ